MALDPWHPFQVQCGMSTAAFNRQVFINIVCVGARSTDLFVYSLIDCSCLVGAGRSRYIVVLSSWQKGIALCKAVNWWHQR